MHEYKVSFTRNNHCCAQLMFAVKEINEYSLINAAMTIKLWQIHNQAFTFDLTSANKTEPWRLPEYPILPFCLVHSHTNKRVQRSIMQCLLGISQEGLFSKHLVQSLLHYLVVNRSTFLKKRLWKYEFGSIQLI